MGNKTLLQRFEEKYVPVTESGCWLWIGSLKGKGYGSFWDGRNMGLAHRISYELFKGKIDGESLDHVCNVRICVNPDHLRVMSIRENVLKGSCPPALNEKKTLCIRGHSLGGPNCYNRVGGGRRCRTCMKLYFRKRRGSKLPHYE